LAAGFVPAYDTAHPQRLNFRYVQADGRASWVADPVQSLPDAVRAAASFSPMPQIIADDSAWHGYVAGGGAPRFASPAATVTHDGADVILKLQGSPEADGMALTLPATAGLTRVTVDGSAVPVSGAPRRLLISCASPGCRNATVILTRNQTGPFTLLLSEQRYGLPAGGEKLLKARGDLATPSQFGDGTELVTRLRID
jgi:hypothetical protein